MTDIAKDVQAYLQAHPAVQEMVTDPYIGSDDAWVHGWIFDSNLKVRIENSQRCAIVVSYGGGWFPSLESNTVRFPLVVVDIWADPTRKADMSVAVDDAKTKCFDIYDAVFKALHLVNRDTPSGGAIFFDQTMITSSESLGDPDLTWVDEGNGARMLRGRFGLSY